MPATEHFQGRTLAGRYYIVELIGRGGTADTYRALDGTLGREVAVKILVEHSDDANGRLLAEARAMAGLSHPRIVAVYDAGKESDVYYIVMELLHGKALSSMRGGELGYKQALGYVAEVLEALDYASVAGIVHRDIKPSNIMIVDDERHVKLTDFGLARRVSDVTQPTESGEIVGTISYLAPERFLSKPADARADLYSVGVVMYEIFTGTLPFRNNRDDIVATMYSHVHDLPAPPREINRNIPEPLEAVIMRAIERDPEERYQTAREFYDDVAALVEARPPPHAQAASQKRRSSPHEPAADPQVQRAPERGSAASRARSDALENVLRGMIATRRRNYDEAREAYAMAMQELQGSGNEIEYAKTVLKYGAMVLQKAADGRRDRNELRDAVSRLNDCQQIFREYGLQEQFAHTEYTINALERTAIGVIF
jgi:eukaryotic-like serine/threonine-protein kinase